LLHTDTGGVFAAQREAAVTVFVVNTFNDLMELGVPEHNELPCLDPAMWPATAQHIVPIKQKGRHTVSPDPFKL
jgi:hypothetical protein